MADKQVSVTLTGKDNLSPVFRKVGDAATQAGRTIDNAGRSVQTLDREATTAAQSMSRFEQASARAEQATSRLGLSAAKLGAAVGTAVSAGLLLSVRAAADAQVSQQRLQTTIEATGALFEQYASQVQAVNNTALRLSFDDEDAQDALNGLIQATGNVEESMSQMGLAMDIARGRGIDLASATKIVIAADQERFTALKRLGIAIDENSTKESVLADLQARYAGQAQAYADTNAGTFERWGNTIENFAESVGAALGPAQQLLLVFPGLATGATMLSGALAAVGLSLGPVGLAAAAVLAAAGLYKLWTSAEGLVSPVEVANKAIGNLEQTVRDLYAAGSTLGVLGERATEGIFPNIEKDVARIEEIQNAIAQTNRAIGESGGVATQKQEEDLQRWSFEIMSLADKYGLLNDANLSLAVSSLDVAGAADDLNTVLRYQGEGAAQAQAEVAELFDQWDRGEISAPTLIKDLDTIASSLDLYDENATKSAASTDALGASTSALAEKQIELYNAIYKTTELYNKQHGDGGQNLAGEHREIASALDAEAKARTELAAQQMADAIRNPFSRPETIRLLRTETESYTDAINRQKQAIIDAGSASAAAGNVRPMGQPAGISSVVNNPPKDNTAERAAAMDALTRSFDAATAAATGTTEALDSGFQVVVGNTNAIAKSAQGVQDWADELIGAAGTYATMDDLLSRGIVTQEDYNAAQAAYTPIAEANRRIQDDVLAIQTRQAPILADLTQQQAEYMDTVAAMEPAQQAFNLAMMDSATSAEALQLATSLLGENGDVFAPMVEAAANLDPYLASILSQMGLIEQQDDGTWTVTLDDQASAPMSDLASSMQALTDQIYILTTYLDADETNDGISYIESQMADLSAFVATPTVDLVDNASGPLYAISGLMGGLNGMTATTYVQTVYESVTSDTRTGAKAYGGTISPYGYSRAAANGMTATLVGENEPEIVMLPGGAQVMPGPGSRSRMRAQGGSDGFTFNNYGTIIGVDDLKEQIIGAWAQAWQRANYQHERSMGV